MNPEPLLTNFQDVLNRMKDGVLGTLPDILGAALLFLLGLALARLLRSLLHRILLNPDHLLSGQMAQEDIRKVWINPSLVRILSGFVYWMILFLFLTASTETLGLPVVTIWLTGIANYLPRILTAVLIGVAGYVGANLLQTGVVRTARSLNLAATDTLGNIVRFLVIALSLLIAVDLIGIDISLVVNIIYIVIAALLLAAALAFGLGARTVVSNILASYYVQKTYEVGQRVKIDEIEGRISQITPTALILQTATEQVHIPAERFNDASSTLILEEG